MKKNHFIFLAALAGVSIFIIGTAVGIAIGMERKMNPPADDGFSESDALEIRAQVRKEYLLTYEQFREGKVTQEELEKSLLSAQRAGVLIMGSQIYGVTGSKAVLVGVYEEDASGLEINDTRYLRCDHFYSELRGCAVLYRTAHSAKIDVYIPTTGELSERAFDPILITEGELVLDRNIGDAGYASRFVEVFDLKKGTSKMLFRARTEVGVTETGDVISEAILLPNGRGLLHVQKERALSAPGLGAGGAPGNTVFEGEIFSIETSTIDGEYQRGKSLLSFSEKVPGELEGERMFTVREKEMLNQESVIDFSFGGKNYSYDTDSQELKVKI